MSSKKVCAIIVTYNGIRWIEECLKSIRNSSIEIDAYVVDNDSRDETYSILKKANCTFLEKSDINLGFGKANNIAIRKAYNDGYDYFFLLNQDAKVDTDTAEGLISGMERKSKFGITSPMHFNWEGNDLDPFFDSYLFRMKTFQNDVASNTLQEDQLYESPFINAACWMMSREVIEKVGLFHPLFDHYGEDDNYLDRLFYHGFKLGLKPNLKMFHDRDKKIKNPLKDDFRRLFKRTLLIFLLNPLSENSDLNDRLFAKRLASKLSKKLNGSSRFFFRFMCMIDFPKIRKEVSLFEKAKSSELYVV